MHVGGAGLYGPYWVKSAEGAEVYIRIVSRAAPTVAEIHGFIDDEVKGAWAVRATSTVLASGSNVIWIRIPDHQAGALTTSSLGPVEARTIHAAIKKIKETCKLVGPVGVWGMSYGGAVA